MKITLKDGSEKVYGQAMSVYDIAKDISEEPYGGAPRAVKWRRGCRKSVQDHRRRCHPTWYAIRHRATRRVGFRRLARERESRPL